MYTFIQYLVTVNFPVLVEHKYIKLPLLAFVFEVDAL